MLHQQNAESNENRSENSSTISSNPPMTPQSPPSNAVYRDYSHVTQEQINTDSNNQSSNKRSSSFPMRLHRLLSAENCSHIVSWLPHGRAWKIFRSVDFEEQLMPQFLFTGRFSSFSRQVRAWDFKLISHGPDEGAYYHEFFLRGMPHLCTRMSISSGPKPVLQSRMRTVERPVPDLYRMSQLHPLPAANNDHTTQGEESGPEARQQVQHSFSVLTCPLHREAQRRPTATGTIERTISSTASVVLPQNEVASTRSPAASSTNQDQYPNRTGNTSPSSSISPNTNNSNVVHAYLIRSDNDPFQVFQERLQERTELINSLYSITRSQRNNRNLERNGSDSERTTSENDNTRETSAEGERAQSQQQRRPVNGDEEEAERPLERQEQQQQQPLSISLVSDGDMSATELSDALGVIEQMIWTGQIRTDPPSASITISNTEVPMVYHGGGIQPLPSLLSRPFSSNAEGGSESGGVADGHTQPLPQRPDEVSSLSSDLPVVPSSSLDVASTAPQVSSTSHHPEDSGLAVDHVRQNTVYSISSSLGSNGPVDDAATGLQSNSSQPDDVCSTSDTVPDQRSR